MPWRAALSAAAAALTGALVWALLVKWTELELDILATGIGVAIGAGAAWMGGRGVTCGAVCAVLAIGSIYGGRQLGAQWMLDARVEPMLTRSSYEQSLDDAASLAKNDTPHGHLRFKRRREYRESFEVFSKYTLPSLRRIHAEQPSYEDWREIERETLASILMEEGPIADAARVSGLFNLMFTFLGVVAAFRVGSGPLR